MDVNSTLQTWLLQPLITLVVMTAIVLGTFEVLGSLISKSAIVFDWVSRVLHPIVRAWSRLVPHPEANSRVAQCIVAGAFFGYFILRLPTSDRFKDLHLLDKTVAFSYVVLLMLTLTAYGTWMARHYRRHFSGLLFYHRKVKPVWDWFAFQSYALLWLDQIPVLRPVIGALDDVAKRVHHRRWQIFLRCLFALSLFTLPVQMLPQAFYDQSKRFIVSPVDVVLDDVFFGPGRTDLQAPRPHAMRRLSYYQQRAAAPGAAHARKRHLEPRAIAPELPADPAGGRAGLMLKDWIENNRWFGVPVSAFVAIYFYLFDWMLTILILYFVVAVLAPLEPRNLFPSIEEGLQYFVEKHKVFIFAGYFWRNNKIDSNEFAPTLSPSSWAIQAAQWEETAQLLHKEMVRLDQFLLATYQGINARVAAVFDEPGPDGKPAKPVCIHYRRFGKSAFLVAVDEHESQFAGTNASSQTHFFQLSESVGSLVNIRHSLKFSSSHLEGAIVG
jgi:hypothetical protein